SSVSNSIFKLINGQFRYLRRGVSMIYVFKMRQIFSQWAIIISAIALLYACHQPSEKNKKKIFRYNEYAGIASLDPAFAKNQSTMWPAHQLFNTLVEIDDSLNIKPSLAKHWDISPDKTTYTFYLRDDVWFHDDACFPDGKGRKM